MIAIGGGGYVPARILRYDSVDKILRLVVSRVG
jgi:hypoxanthine phosphoribosyltransferase